ncbi:unnamed protein product [Rotaria magnacalcarata]|uniref:Protein-tyrosine-phosphatase n=3 Tax=Rotaria magnacalcarata TaxID=392030 RepID=A0A816AQK1_9BILA|nr:unnamed protein product [Rotaria magnacalcarata]CAF1601284.1 unnamed protein product [Rotaria magnacalcarata]CAF1996184.1 unnamed protein product [Rotaria magnacalcarata]CAF2156386.1 unnamed protein product [Rotaria magnacalcarata]CAF3770051.1 unnamed protein product [Rotaria magnacalcarata]
MLGITEVVDNLYISGLESSAAIYNKGIRSVINISSECPMQDLGPSVEYEKVSIPDLPTTSIQPYFDRLADRIDQHLRQGKKTLVHCYVGRSRSASIILAYLMKYRQMSLREAFYYLRSRRPIIGPNFGFIKQLVAFEKSLFGSTTVSFVETSFGSVPDIYLSIGGGSISPRRQTNTIPIQVTNRTALSSLSSRPSSFLSRSTANSVSNQSSRISSSYSNNNTNTNAYRPLNSLTNTSSTYNSSSFLHDQPEPSRFISTAYKPYESIHEPYLSSRLNALRTGKYVPPILSRFNLP